MGNYVIPVWMQIVVGLGGFVLAVATLWNKVINPIRKAGHTAEEMYPLLVKLTEVFADNPDALKVLYEIAAQFRTNNGSSLRDVVDGLSGALTKLQQQTEIAQILAERDREQLQRLLTLLDRLDAKVSGGRNAMDRIELDQVNVARHLTDAQARADAIEGYPGEAADAFTQSPKKEPK